MKRVITYGTFDLLHYGHINLLKRAKALGDYLIVVLSTDEFNWNEKHKKCYFTYEQRKERKRQFRQLWIARINAAARMNGISYSQFMYGLKKANVDINRKMLAEMAVNDAEGFATLAELAKSKLA